MAIRSRGLALAVVTCFILAARSALAQTFPDPVPVPERGFLQTEAVNVLAAQGFPADKTKAHARSRIRAYVFGRLLGIVRKDAADRSVEEQAAYSRLRSAVQKNRAALAENAVQYWQSIADGDKCFSGGAGTIWVAPSIVVSLVCELFQEQRPNQREVYRGQGAAELYAALLTGNGAVELTAMLGGMDWFAGRAAAESGPLFDADSQPEMDYQAVMDVFRYIRDEEQTTLLSWLIRPELGPVEVIVALLVVGSTIWDLVDFAVIGNDLKAAAATAGTADPDLEGAITGQLTELALVFMGETLGRRRPPPFPSSHRQSPAASTPTTTASPGRCAPPTPLRGRALCRPVAARPGRRQLFRAEGAGSRRVADLHRPVAATARRVGHSPLGSRPPERRRERQRRAERLLDAAAGAVAGRRHQSE